VVAQREETIPPTHHSDLFSSDDDKAGDAVLEIRVRSDINEPARGLGTYGIA
jgi:hypothetical protein